MAGTLQPRDDEPILLDRSPFRAMTIHGIIHDLSNDGRLWAVVTIDDDEKPSIFRAWPKTQTIL